MAINFAWFIKCDPKLFQLPIDKMWPGKTKRKAFIPIPASPRPPPSIFPKSAIVKPILEDRAESKASMPDCKNVKKIATILSMWDERDLTCEMWILIL